MKPHVSTSVKWAVLACALLFVQVSIAQTFNVSNTTVTIDGYAYTNDYIVPEVGGFLVFDEDSCVFAPQAWVPGFYGNDYAYLCNRTAREKKYTPPQSVTSAQVFSHGRVNGDGTQSMKVQWYHEARSFTNSLEGYSAFSENDLDFTVSVVVTGPPAGTPVNVLVDYSSFASGLTDHEAADEDPVVSINSLTIDGTEVLQGTHDFIDPPGLSGWNNRLNEPVAVSVVAGTPFDIEVTSELATTIEMPGKTYGFFSVVDQCVAALWGEVNLNMVIPNYPPGNVLGNDIIEFSLDIGSDAELSDPQFDGDEVFDPGDAYPFMGPIMPLGGSDGVKDDATIFGFDPMPAAPDPTVVTGAPVGSGMSLYTILDQWFDLDGHENIQADLSQMQFVPGMTSLPVFPDPCIFQPQFVLISFDDDSLPNYLDPAISVAVATGSPFNFATYGTTPFADEIIELTYAPTYPTTLLAQIGVFAETMIHPNLPPNPDLGEPEDDDVDALDIMAEFNQCQNWYFSADHEARYVHPMLGGPLNPGSVYQVTTPGSIVEVVNPVTHLGLPDSCDIDAFEFTWVWDTLELRYGFAMLFSMDDDDPLTTADESGGLDPRHLYATFLNGTYFQFSVNPLEEDIDAISCWEHSLNGTQGGGGPVGLLDEDNATPWLSAFPNPFTDQMRIDLNLPKSDHVKVELLDNLGRVVTTIAEGTFANGNHTFNWNATDVVAGTYSLSVKGSEGISVIPVVKVE